MIEDPAAVDQAPEGRQPLVSHIVDPIALHRAARAIGGGFKPWGVIVDRLMTGAIPFTATSDRIGRIEIGAQDARSLLMLDLARPSVLPTTCSQRDALEILNLPARHAQLLKEFADADDDWEMGWDKVLTLAATRITLAELSARTGINSVRLERRLEEEGCPRLDRFGWWRTKALNTLQRVFPKQGAPR